jgi:membrane protease YdiL (CAAX protease family)
MSAPDPSFPPDDLPFAEPVEQPLDLDPPAFELDDKPAPVVPAVECWRCGRVEPPTDGRCPWCQARVCDPGPRRRDGKGRSTHPVTVLLVVYGLMLVVSVLWGWVMLAGGPRMTEEDMLTGTFVVEAIDTVLVVVTLGVLGRVGLPAPRPGARPTAWAVAAPMLFVLLCLNLAYTGLLRDFIGLDGPAKGPGLTAVIVVLVCVQPAIIEELFFRYAALGVLRRATGLHAAVWVTAAMFAMAHIYNPLGVPYLFLAGVAFGYARVWGGLPLSILLHFVHNLAVVAIEGVR